MTNLDFREKFLAPAAALAIGAALAIPFALSSHHAHGAGPSVQAPAAIPVSVATVTPRDAIVWN